MGHRTYILLLSLSAGLITGCVDRRFVVTTNVPGAQVAIDGRTIGPSPADATYDYAGWYEFRANAPGYEPLVQRHKFEPKWYDYPGLDFFAEVIWPFRIEDKREVFLEMMPARPIKNEDLISRGDALRAQAQTLPPPRVPNDEVQPPLGDRKSMPDNTPRPPGPVILPGTR
jgi:hypothetical protein